ncbi:hypothetical protein PCE1_003183 [Barthelona sp. PCE]
MDYIRRLDFVDADGDDLICPICMDVLDLDCVASACQHIFCRSCFDALETHQENPTCPVCRSVAKPISIPVAYFMKILRTLHVHCPNKAQGCEWEGEYADIETHMKMCERALIQCDYCSRSFSRITYPRHTEVCSMRTFKCCFCDGEFLKSESHNLLNCSKYKECSLSGCFLPKGHQCRNISHSYLMECAMNNSTGPGLYYAVDEEGKKSDEITSEPSKYGIVPGINCCVAYLFYYLQPKIAVITFDNSTEEYKDDRGMVVKRADFSPISSAFYLNKILRFPLTRKPADSRIKVGSIVTLPKIENFNYYLVKIGELGTVTSIDGTKCFVTFPSFYQFEVDISLLVPIKVSKGMLAVQYKPSYNMRFVRRDRGITKEEQIRTPMIGETFHYCDVPLRVTGYDKTHPQLLEVDGIPLSCEFLTPFVFEKGNLVQIKLLDDIEPRLGWGSRVDKNTVLQVQDVVLERNLLCCTVFKDDSEEIFRCFTWEAEICTHLKGAALQLNI